MLRLHDYTLFMKYNYSYLFIVGHRRATNHGPPNTRLWLVAPQVYGGEIFKVNGQQPKFQGIILFAFIITSIKFHQKLLSALILLLINSVWPAVVARSLHLWRRWRISHQPLVSFGRVSLPYGKHIYQFKITKAYMTNLNDILKTIIKQQSTKKTTVGCLWRKKVVNFSFTSGKKYI